MDDNLLSGILTAAAGLLIMLWNSSRPDVHARYGQEIARKRNEDLRQRGR